MTVTEIKKVFDELKAEGNDDDDILAILYLMFQDGKLTIDELSDCVQILGYELTPEFLAMSPEDQKTKGYEEIDEPEVPKKRKKRK